MTCLATNQLAMPGLGSLMGKRWLAGWGQVFLSIAGCALIVIWFLDEMIQYYGLIGGNGSVHPVSTKTLMAGTILFCAAWIWSGLTSFSLLREASANESRPLKNFAAPPMLKMDAAQIAPALTSIPNWTQSGDVISRTFQFKNFPAAMKFVNAVADLAEASWHHPDIDVRWNKVTLALTTHDAGGLTEKDFALAREFNALALRPN